MGQLLKSLRAALTLVFFLQIPVVTSIKALKVLLTEDKVPTPEDPWVLYVFGDPNVPIYLDDSVEKLMKLCGEPGKEKCPLVDDPTNCILDCKLEKDFQYPNGTIVPSTRVRLVLLERVKVRVKGIQDHMNNKLRTSFLWLFWFAICFGGIYLNVMDHYQCVNLPFIGDDLLDAPTDGIKYSHYMWMKWIILGNTNCHWTTYMKDGAFIYHWKPLSEHKWDRPPTPEERRWHEPRDSEHPPWTIDEINEEMEGESEFARIQEYWHRMYQWAWARYRYKKAPSVVLNIKKSRGSKLLRRLSKI